MLISILQSSEVGFGQLLVAVLVLNALIIGVLTFAPGLHRRLAHWIWPKHTRRY